MPDAAPPRRFEEKGFRHAFGETGRVVRALIMRETVTRFGRHQLGYAWALIEPIEAHRTPSTPPSAHEGTMPGGGGSG